MNSYPIRSANISQTLLMKEEKMIKPINEMDYKNVATISGIVPVLSETDEMDRIMPAFIAQSRLSTYYQDKPFDILNSSQKYGMMPMGGPVNSTMGSGYRPGTLHVNPSNNGSNVSAFHHKH
jgi:hypothetical protein